MLANEWDAEELDAWGLDVPDFGKELEAEEDDFETPEGGIETDIVLGDLFEIGEHRLLCGSSTEIDTWANLMGNELCDLVITDPPYNVALGMETKEQAKARNRRTDGLVIKNDKMSNDDFYKFLYDFFTSIGSYSKKGASIYVWYASSEVVNFVSALVASGWFYKQELIWNKNAMIMGRQDYQWKHEPCLYGWKEGDSHNWNSDRKQTTILEFNKPSRNGEHPTMKPVELIAYQVSNSSKIGNLVCDGFLGSGTTMVAAHQLNRKCYGMELDPKYCQVIVDRMRKLDPAIKIKRNGVDYGI
jgi:site-specific DNA-methyltransferase (adenine-specific)